MDEIEFAEAIDSHFPYHDRVIATGLIDIANSLSDNAKFMVLEELCRPPLGTDVSEKTLLDLIDIWNNRTSHPLAHSVVKVARLMATDTDQSVNEAIQLMNEIAPFKGQYCALNIAYFSCDDKGSEIEAANDEIRRLWES